MAGDEHSFESHAKEPLPSKKVGLLRDGALIEGQR